MIASETRRELVFFFCPSEAIFGKRMMLMGEEIIFRPLSHSPQQIASRRCSRGPIGERGSRREKRRAGSEPYLFFLSFLEQGVSLFLGASEGERKKSRVRERERARARERERSLERTNISGHKLYFFPLFFFLFDFPPVFLELQETMAPTVDATGSGRQVRER